MKVFQFTNHPFRFKCFFDAEDNSVAIVHHDTDSNYETMYDIAADNKLCVKIDVADEDSAEISFLEYDKGCAEPELQHGLGTVKMIHAAMSLTTRLFPRIHSFYLQDTSSRFCDDSGSKMSLSTHGILVYGGTWYERKLNAILVTNKKSWKKAKEKLQRVVSPDEIDRFLPHVYANIHTSLKTDEAFFAIQCIFQDLNHKSWNDLFFQCHVQFGCVFFASDPLQAFFRRYFKIPFGDRWKIIN